MSDLIDEEEQPQPELLDDRTIELMILGARAMVIVVYAVVVVTFGLLTLGFILHLTGASSEASFVDWAYRNTERAMQPFRGMFPVQKIDGRSVFDPSLLFAAAFYGFFAIGLHAVVNYLSGLARTRHRTLARLQQPVGSTQRLPVVSGSAAAVDDDGGADRFNDETVRLDR